jgi:signal transduction histidine kinase
MVDDLFDLSRLQAGGFGVDTEPVQLDDLVSDCLAALEPLARAAQVQLRGHRDRPVTVTGNVAELNRALTNLVANAVQHTAPGGQVAVRLHADGEHAVVLVRDQCGGIPQAAMSRVFEVGYRHEPARTPRPAEPGGAGLGLAITRGIVGAHAGTVDVRNVPGGCEFRLELPA